MDSNTTKSIKTISGLDIKSCYGPDDSQISVSYPGHFPFLRGIHEEMYREKLWTMRQYAGFGSAKESNERYRYLLAKGGSGLSVAFDLPTQMGFDPDDPRAQGEVGRVGVSISTIDDLRQLFDQIPLEKVSISMTINATAPILLAMLVVLAQERGVELSKLRGTTQNDILKEYIARGTYIYPPSHGLRLIADVFEYCAANVPNWNTISVSGYHMREAGCTAIQELAFTFANAITYLELAKNRNLNLVEVASRMSFFFNCHIDFFEEIAKFRAARLIWSTIIRERFGIADQNAAKLRFHTQTAGSSLTAQQPKNNIVRTAIQGLAAVLGGTQSLHTNAYDEALGLPTEESAEIALRTQQIIAYESGAPATVDPLGGSYFIENLTLKLKTEALNEINKIDQIGGMLKAIEENYPQSEIEKSAYEFQINLENKSRILVGVNQFLNDNDTITPIMKINSKTEKQQCRQIKNFRKKRHAKTVESSLNELIQSARGGENLMHGIIECVKNNATLGEISAALKSIFGVYRGNF